jgi:putative hemolysin
MDHSALFWLGATLFWTFVMSFYSTQEMACISFNRLRLEYYLKQNKRFAKWLNYLLDHPTTLFSTTLIGVNCALMASSECARRFYEALGMNPNFAPITQIPFILLFGELVPMFAARIHAEHMCRLGVPFLYLTAKILTPIIAVVDFCFRNLTRYFSKKDIREASAFLSREELQKLIEEHETGPIPDAKQHINEIVDNLFSLKGKLAFQLMEKLPLVPCASSHTTVADIRKRIAKLDDPYILIFHKVKTKIVGIVLIQDLLHASDSKKVSEFIRPACFVSENTPILELINQLQEEKLPIAVVLDTQGEAQGAITLDNIFDELFSSEEEAPEIKIRRRTYLEKTFSAETKINDFNEAYGLEIDAQGCKTFAELIEQILGRNPCAEDTLFIEPIEIVVKETSLFKAKTILIRTKALS